MDHASDELKGVLQANPKSDGDGYLADMSERTPEIGRLIAEADGCA